MQHREIESLYVETRDRLRKFGIEQSWNEANFTKCDRIDSDDKQFYVFKNDEQGEEYLIATVSKAFPYVVDYKQGKSKHDF